MLPGNRRKMLQVLVRNNLSLLSQIGDRLGQIDGIPQDDQGDMYVKEEIMS